MNRLEVVKSSPLCYSARLWVPVDEAVIIQEGEVLVVQRDFEISPSLPVIENGLGDLDATRWLVVQFGQDSATWSSGQCREESVHRVFFSAVTTKRESPKYFG